MLLPSHFGRVYKSTIETVCPLAPARLSAHMLCACETNCISPSDPKMSISEALSSTCSLEWLTAVTQTPESPRGAGRRCDMGQFPSSAVPLICFGLNWAHNQDYTLFNVLSNLTNAYPVERINFWGSSLCCSPLFISSSENTTPPEPPWTCPPLYSNPKLNKSHFYSGWRWLWTLSKPFALTYAKGIKVLIYTKHLET